MFIPGAANSAARLDEGMREHLALSLERIAGMARPVLGEPAGLDEALAHIRGHRIEPGAFALYYDLVFALQASRHDDARADWRQLMARVAPAASLEVIAFGLESMGEDAARFARLLAIGAARPLDFLPPPAEAWTRFRATWPAALALLEAASPAWAQELRDLVVRLIATTPGETHFSGGSSAMTWGALLVNVEAYRDRLGVLVTVIHEAAHLLLLGLAREDPLATNPVGERYATAMRPIPRPMIALYHSTYTSARTALLCRLLAAEAVAELTASERAEVEQMQAHQLRKFRDGYDKVDAEGALTPLGRRLIDEAKAELEGG